MLKVDGDKTARHRTMELVKLSLSCIAYINRQNADASILLMQNRDAILRLCM